MPVAEDLQVLEQGVGPFRAGAPALAVEQLGLGHGPRMVRSRGELPWTPWSEWITVPGALQHGVLVPTWRMVVSAVGGSMTVTYETPRVTRVGSLHALALTDEDGSNADADRFQAAYGSPICATS